MSQDPNSPEHNEENLNKEPGQASTELDTESSQDTAQASTPTIEDSLQAVQSDLQNAREDVLRAQAEIQNMRRRCERDVGNAHKFALDKFVAELLPVVDNLERAIASAQGADPKFVEGIELTLKGFAGVLEKFNVVAVEPEGQPFDPELHQAMSMVPNPDMENNTVMTAFQKGYTLNGRLVRPAMVVVVKN